MSKKREVSFQEAIPSTTSLSTTQVCRTIQTALDNMGRALRCPLCLSTFTEDPVIVSNCVHAYCRSCLGLALKEKQRCPTCHQPCSRRSVQADPLLQTISHHYLKTLRHFGLTPVHFTASVPLTQLQEEEPRDLASVHRHVMVSRTFAKAITKGGNPVLWKEHQQVVAANEQALLDVVRQRQLQRTEKSSNKKDERNDKKQERNTDTERNDITNEAELACPNVTVRKKHSRPKLPPPSSSSSSHDERTASNNQGENDRSVTVNHSSSFNPEEIATTAAVAATSTRTAALIKKHYRPKLPPLSSSHDERTTSNNQGENDRRVKMNHSSSFNPEEVVATAVAATSTRTATVITPRPGGDVKRPATSVSVAATTPRTVNDERITNQKENDLCITVNNNNSLSSSANPPHRTAANTITPRAEVRSAESSVATNAAATPRRPQDNPPTRPRSNEGAAHSLSVATAAEDTTIHTTAPALITPTAATYSVGGVVNVQSRTWPGINKPGGVAKVTAVHAVGGSHFYNVRYVLGGQEKRVEAIFVTPKEDAVRRTAEKIPSHLLKRLAQEGFDVETAVPNHQIIKQESKRIIKQEPKRAASMPCEQTSSKENAANRKRSAAGTSSAAIATKPPTKRQKLGQAIQRTVAKLLLPSKKKQKRLTIPSCLARKRALADEFYGRNINAALKKSVIHVVATNLNQDDLGDLKRLVKETKGSEGTCFMHTAYYI
jgi:hypothetical protein